MQASSPTVESAKRIRTFAPDQGLLEDAFAFDGAGSRFLYVRSDVGSTSTLVVWDLVQDSELFSVPLGAFTLKPTKASFALDGEHFVVWKREGSEQKVALLNRRGKVLRQFGPATEIRQIVYDGTEALVLYSVKEESSGGRKHTVSVASVKGAVLGKRTHLSVDSRGGNDKLEFSLLYWLRDYTIAVGIKRGRWNKKNDQRGPDALAWYQLPTRTFIKERPITDLVKVKKDAKRLSSHTRREILFAADRSELRYADEGKSKMFRLAEPLAHYEPSSLVMQHSPPGTSMFFSLTVDPVHPAAAAKRRAVRPWLDVYELVPGARKAVRRARFLPEGDRHVVWRARGSYVALMTKHVGFDRGGQQVDLYKLK